MSDIGLDELSQKNQNVLKNLCTDLSELNKLSEILNLIKDNKHLFKKFEHEITVTFRGSKVI